MKFFFAPLFSFIIFFGSTPTHALPAYKLLPNYQDSWTTEQSPSNTTRPEQTESNTTPISENTTLFQRLFEKGKNRAAVLNQKNKNLSTPLNIHRQVTCIKNTEIEEFVALSADPESAFSQWMDRCGIAQAFAALEDKNTEIQALSLRKTFHFYPNISVPEYTIGVLLDPQYRDSTTGTLLGNEQGFVHRLQNQQNEEMKILGVQELIGVGLSNYSGSTWNRKANIKNAVQKLHGTIIHPGESFSVGKALYPFTSYNGYHEGIIIKEGKNEKEIAGGVCQSVTTLFRAWNNAGLEISRFQPHSKSISYYGGIGLDATLYYPSVDLVLKNTSNHSVLIHIEDRDPYQLVMLYGTKDRNVQINRTSLHTEGWRQTATWSRLVQYEKNGEWHENQFEVRQRR